jgi:hypothetical protein
VLTKLSGLPYREETMRPGTAAELSQSRSEISLAHGDDRIQGFHNFAKTVKASACCSGTSEDPRGARAKA